LIAGGIVTLEELAYVPMDELLEIEEWRNQKPTSFGRGRGHIY